MISTNFRNAIKDSCLKVANQANDDKSNPDVTNLMILAGCLQSAYIASVSIKEIYRYKNSTYVTRWGKDRDGKVSVIVLWFDNIYCQDRKEGEQRHRLYLDTTSYTRSLCEVFLADESELTLCTFGFDSIENAINSDIEYKDGAGNAGAV